MGFDLLIRVLSWFAVQGVSIVDELMDVCQ